MQIFNRFLCCSFGLKTETKPQKQKQREEEAAEETEICKWMGLSWPLSSVWAFGHLCTRFALTLAWHELNPHLNRMRMRYPLQLIPLSPPPTPLPRIRLRNNWNKFAISAQSFYPNTKHWNSSRNKETNRRTSRRDGRANWPDGRTETDNRHSKRYKTASKLCGCSGCPRRLPPCGCLVGAFDCKQVQTRLKVCGKGAGTRHKQATQLDYDLANTL